MNETILRGARIKAARKAKQWTLKDLAKAASMSYPYISMLERGKRGAQVKIEELKKLAATLDVELDFLINGTQVQDSDIPILTRDQIGDFLKERPRPFYFRLENDSIEEHGNNQRGKLVLIDPNLIPVLGDKVLVKSQHSEQNFFMRRLTVHPEDGRLVAESTGGNWLPIPLDDDYDIFGVLFELNRA